LAPLSGAYGVFRVACKEVYAPEGCISRDAAALIAKWKLFYVFVSGWVPQVAQITNACSIAVFVEPNDSFSSVQCSAVQCSADRYPFCPWRYTNCDLETKFPFVTELHIGLFRNRNCSPPNFFFLLVALFNDGLSTA
jgi:hypothetical protein